MNANLTLSTGLSAELHQLRCEVASHRAAIEVEAAAMARSSAVWVAQEPEIARRMAALRQRLALLA